MSAGDEVVSVLGGCAHQAAIAVGRLRQLHADIAGLLNDAEAGATVLVRFDPEDDMAFAKRRFGIAKPVAPLLAWDPWLRLGARKIAIRQPAFAQSRNGHRAP